MGRDPLQNAHILRCMLFLLIGSRARISGRKAQLAFEHNLHF